MVSLRFLWHNLTDHARAALRPLGVDWQIHAKLSSYYVTHNNPYLQISGIRDNYHRVKGAINKILTHNGCIIADSVGLGKTFEALAIIKYFELLNYKVLVLCPQKLRENWTIYQAQNNSELNPFIKDTTALAIQFCLTPT